MADLVVREHISLRPYTTLKVGGTARYLIDAHTEEEVVAAVEFAHERQLPLFILGAGSNVLVADGEYAGVVLRVLITNTRTIDKVSGDTILYTVGAGEDLDTVIADTIEQGWWGMENLSAIPSSIGAVPVQNVGAYGVEASQLIVAVRVFNRGTNSIELWSREQCQFAYRDSIFKHIPGCQAIVLSVTFALSTTPTPRLTYKDLLDYFGSTTPTQKEIRDAVISIRSKKFPDWRAIGTAGSFFKNPIISAEEAESLKQQYADLPIYETDAIDKKKISLGFVLDKICHRRGYQEGNVSLYEHQALVLCVVPHTDAQAVIDFAKKITEAVFLATHISIEWEVVLLS